MVQCCVCPFGKCSADCPALDVLPYEGPMKEESIRKIRKLQAAGMGLDQIKDELKIAGTFAAKNELIDKWIKEFEDDLYHLIKKKALLTQKQIEFEELTRLLAHKTAYLKALKTVAWASHTVADIADDEGGLLDGPSSSSKD